MARAWLNLSGGRFSMWGDRRGALRSCGRIRLNRKVRSAQNSRVGKARPGARLSHDRPLRRAHASGVIRGHGGMNRAYPLVSRPPLPTLR